MVDCRSIGVVVRTIVVAAHPDDEVLGCGGTVARLSNEGDVWICILGEGVTSRYNSSQTVPETELVNLKSQASLIHSQDDKMQKITKHTQESHLFAKKTKK